MYFRPPGKALAIFAIVFSSIMLSMISIQAEAAGVPVAIPATNVGGNFFSANWNAAVGADSYRLAVSSDPAFPPGSTTTYNAGGRTTYLVMGVTAQTVYYKVQSEEAGLYSAYSNVITVTLNPTSNTKPGAPVAASATNVTSSGFQANWSSVTGAEKYCVEMASDWGFTDYNWGGFTSRCTGTATKLQIDGLRADWTYVYRVRAWQGGLASAYSNSISVHTGQDESAVPDPPEKPYAGNGVSDNPGTDPYTVELSNNCKPGENALFYVGDQPFTEGAKPDVEFQAGSTGSQSLTLTPPNPGQTYYYYSQCCANGNCSTVSDTYESAWRAGMNPGVSAAYKPSPSAEAERILIWWDKENNRFVARGISLGTVYMSVKDPENELPSEFNLANFTYVDAELHLIGTSVVLSFREQETGEVYVVRGEWSEAKSIKSMSAKDSGAKALDVYIHSTNVTLDNKYQTRRGADYDGDGLTELLLRDTHTGKMTMWHLDKNFNLEKAEDVTLPAGLVMQDLGNPKMEGYSVSKAPDDPPNTIGTLEWEIRVASDFDGDGKADLLFYNPLTGELVLWNMNGASVKGLSCLSPENSREWKMEASGDFNGDGKTDLIWRNRNDGAMVMWLMDGLKPSAMTSMAQTVDWAWRIKGVLDYNGDGKDDIHWRHDGDYQVIVWLLDGPTVKQGISLGSGQLFQPWGSGN